ncbi:PTS sugar transporter subunit IIC [Schnuerera sp. xch1]|uniref:PTS sugar transporter subunit IIC n=1 Tax=Schnuerera sp. xch1 TaxID=2874283 RepID=UPI001CBB4733|nr:PTS sugar transporter subunit IIC [Schnuerera sp. xch1]MBZ2175378.1 PTS sugar transporter subunit IIC [Schnuerera sp. xch1]
MFDRLEKVLMPTADKLGKNKTLVAIRDGFLISTPLIIVGSLFLLIANFPIPGWSEFWARFFGEGWESYLSNVARATFDVISLLTVIGVGYSYAREIEADKIQGAIVAIVSFIILMPTSITYEGAGGIESLTAINFSFIGTNGIFLAMVVSILSVSIFSWAYKKGWTIKMPKGVPPAVADSFAALIPSAMVMFVFFLLRIVFELTPYESAHNFIYTVLQAPLMGAGNSLGAQIIYVVSSSVFWFFGINGPAVTNTVFSPIFRTLSIENLQAFEAGSPLPHIYTGQFVDLFQTFGGGGSTLSLVIIMMLFCKSKRITQLGKLSIVPGIFGINEPIIFGLPIVLNPIMIIPFIGVPFMNTVLSAIAFETGFLPYTNGVALPWTTPLGFSGYLSTGSLKASLVQVVLVILGCIVYYPFIKMLDKTYLKDEQYQSEEDELEDISFDNLSMKDL